MSRSRSSKSDLLNRNFFHSGFLMNKISLFIDEYMYLFGKYIKKNFLFTIEININIFLRGTLWTKFVNFQLLQKLIKYNIYKDLITNKLFAYLASNSTS